MKSWRAKALLLAGAAALLAALPALGQDDARIAAAARLRRPADPAAARGKATPHAARAAQQPAPPTPAGAVGRPTEPSPATRSATSRRSRSIRCGAAAADQLFHRFPKARARPTDLVGPLGARQFRPRRRRLRRRNGGRSRRPDAPARRAAAVALDLDPAAPRLAVAARRAAPASHPVDWVAERAALLLRMGEADAARMLVQAVDVEQLYAADGRGRGADRARHRRSRRALPAGRARRGAGRTTRSGSLADGMCAALEGEAARASALIDQARDQAGTGIDLLLAEKVVGAGAETRRAVDIAVGRGRRDQRPGASASPARPASRSRTG